MRGDVLFASLGTNLILIVGLLVQNHQMLRQASPLVYSARSSLPRYNLSAVSSSFSPSSILPKLLLKAPSSLNSHHISTSSSVKMADKLNFFEAVEHRRTYYALENKSTISDSRIEELVTKTIKHVPSSFNSQTCRVVVVLNKEHPKLWNMITEVYQTMLPPESFEHAKGRFEMFKNAYGTILFYEDTTRLREFQEKYKTYEDKFPQWSMHSSGMHQYVLWTALEAEGLGCNLQHYNPPIDVKLQSAYDVPSTWSLQSQLVFGKPTGGPAVDPKSFDPIDQRVKYFGKS